MMKSSQISGRNFEKRIFNLLQGLRTIEGSKPFMVPNSGAGKIQKGDIKTDFFLIDCKYTEKQSYTLKASILDKIQQEAFEEHRDPALVIGLNNKTYALIPFQYFVELEEHLTCLRAT